jgi:GNAT superfamily N-acetyltransferase
MSDSSEHELNLDDFAIESRVVSLKELGIYDDLSSWPEWRHGDLKELDEQDRVLELHSFRGAAWAKRAVQWTPRTVPPIVVVTLRNGDTAIGDGRGRVSYAIGMAWKSIPAVFLVERGAGEMRESGPSDDPRKWAALDDSLRDSLRRAQKSKPFNGYEMHWLPHKGGYATIIAVDGNKVVGSLFYGRERPSDETLKGAIEVRPEYRRQGIATELYVWAEQLSGLSFLPDEPHTEAAQALWGQKSRPFGLREATSLESLIESTGSRYPRAGEYVDGRLVRKDVPNVESIDDYMEEQEELPGVRVVPMSDLGNPRSVFYAADDFERSERLAELIGRSGEISPLIIGIDEKGPFIIEGAHRFVALWHLKAREFPAVVVVGRD